jgi:hypothetical protein
MVEKFINQLNFSDMHIAELPQQTLQSLVSKSGLCRRNRNIFRQQGFLSDGTGLTKNSVSWTIDQNRPVKTKEFDPVPTTAQILSKQLC